MLPSSIPVCRIPTTACHERSPDKIIKSAKLKGSGWYFKNGAYNNGLPAGARTSVHFRDLTLWTK
jgi:hypothetical protein